MSDIVERKLRADLDAANEQHMPVMVVQTTYLSDIVKHMIRLRAELAEAQTIAIDALKPFADCIEQIVDDEDDEEWAKFRLLIKDYRRAAQAIRALKSPKPQED